MARNHEEDDICKSFWKSYCQLKDLNQIWVGAFVYHVANENAAGQKIGKKRKDMGVVAGVFDYCVHWSDGIGPKIGYIEFKTPSRHDDLNDAQKAFRANLTYNQIPWAVVTSSAAALATLKLWGVIKNETIL